MSLAACPTAAESCMPDVYVWAQAGSRCAGCPDVPDVSLSPYWAFLTTELLWCLALLVY